MKFGPFPEGHCFHIEKSNCYAAIQKNVKMAEFLLIPPNKSEPVIYVVEAKSSSPKPETQPNFEEFVDSTRDKFVNAFSLGFACRLSRHPEAEAELPDGFKNLDLSTVNVKFVLVIKGHKDEWLQPLQDALGLRLRSITKTWRLSPLSVAVMNEVHAQQRGLIQPFRKTEA